MEFSKRQWTEIDKRNDKLLDLLVTHADVNSIKISLEDKCITMDNGSYILGYFIDYETLKKLQLDTIKVLNEITFKVSRNQIVDRVESLRYKRF